MRVTIFGANGLSGQQLVQKALERGHEVVAYVRGRESMSECDPRVSIVEGTLDSRQAIEQAVTGSDAVILALGTTDRKPNTVLSDGTRTIVEAMQTAGVKQLAAITSMGCGNSKAQVNSRIMKFVIRTFAKEIWADKDRQEQVIFASDLDYLIVRPGGLTKKPGDGDWTELRDGQFSKGSQMISREDVAAYILQRLENPPLGREAVGLV